jgi:hypothetical protein
MEEKLVAGAVASPVMNRPAERTRGGEGQLQLGVHRVERCDGVSRQVVFLPGSLHRGGAGTVQEHEVALLAAQHVIEEVANVPLGTRGWQAEMADPHGGKPSPEAAVSIVESIERVHE